MSTQLPTKPPIQIKKDKKEVMKLLIPQIFYTKFTKDTDRPWLQSNQDLTDYFNYGFCEETFRAYTNQVRACRGNFSINDTYKENEYNLNKMNDKTPLEYGGFSHPFDKNFNCIVSKFVRRFEEENDEEENQNEDFEEEDENQEEENFENYKEYNKKKTKNNRLCGIIRIVYTQYWIKRRKNLQRTHFQNILYK
ncbi:hypothetical protein IMG5_155310 [Ichthyophthirius multifiliis]|uniref:Pre-mRNA polyadenylation factor Fip1 domain-containing protein n=1 Tax=Ichthyophthirius multifiliis TaxID=5932 RepID=G0QZ97_ICHMU|nr:hypothetical protein IMG5_155310 [Ichthyophthirius multifiliis]EGR29454.1 hypothetical protein IMG5_155310 [Ichthyophthirius multifiliis]|eukprot:XP_004030690.1 hypothetical protein IMG5_155310 [Ichthyophthirius multifiliis]